MFGYLKVQMGPGFSDGLVAGLLCDERQSLEIGCLFSTAFF